MKKLAKTVAIALSASMLFSTTALAGWTQDARGWKYTGENGLPYVSTSRWLDGNNDGIAEFYIFDAEGYMYANQTVDEKVTFDDGSIHVVGSTVVNSEGQALDANGNVRTLVVDKKENAGYTATALGVTFNDVEGRLNPLEFNPNSALNKYHSDNSASLTPYGKDSGTSMVVQTWGTDIEGGKSYVKSWLQIECGESKYVREEAPLETYTSPNGVVWYGGVSTYRGETDTMCCGTKGGKVYVVKIFDQDNRIDLQYVLSHLEIN